MIERSSFGEKRYVKKDIIYTHLVKFLSIFMFKTN